MNERVPGPSSAGSVILDLGAGVGALVLDTPAELAGREIEISPVGPVGPGPGDQGSTGGPGGPGAHRTHSLVRERRIGVAPRYAAVYPGLPAGDYTIWRDAVTPTGTVTIDGGQVTHCSWPAS